MRRYLALILFLIPSVSHAFPMTINYSGRLTNTGGSPVTGEVTLEPKFYNAVDAATPLFSATAEAVTLNEGVFSIDITFSAMQIDTVFSNDEVWIEVHAAFPRQKFSVIPYAFRVPVDNETIIFNAEGKLSTNPNHEINVGNSGATCSAQNKGKQRFNDTFNIMQFCNGTRWVEIGAPPVGTIAAWHKDLTGVPSLPWGWIECDGSTLSDSESPLNGQVIPKLNESVTIGPDTYSGLFLRGSSTSGTFQQDATAQNGLNIQRSGYAGGSSCISLQNGSELCLDSSRQPVTDVVVRSSDTETRPANMSVVWIIRVK